MEEPATVAYMTAGQRRRVCCSRNNILSSRWWAERGAAVNRAAGCDRGR